MNLNFLNAATLRTLISLTEKKEKLAAQITELEAKIGTLLAGKTPKAPKSLGTGRSKKRSLGRRGGIKDAILGELGTAGKAGVSVKGLSEKLGLKSQNVHVWFATTGRKLGVKKIGRGEYAL